MTMAVSRNLSNALALVMAHEGGIADVGDGKGVTRYGQTTEWLNEFDFPVPTTPEMAMANYEEWAVRTKLDQVADYDATLGSVVLDFAVNSGTARAITHLQRALGVTADGIIGPETLRALHQSNPLALAHRVLASRMRFVGKILRDNPSTRIYALGWLNRLADQVEQF